MPTLAIVTHPLAVSDWFIDCLLSLSPVHAPGVIQSANWLVAISCIHDKPCSHYSCKWDITDVPLVVGNTAANIVFIKTQYQILFFKMPVQKLHCTSLHLYIMYIYKYIIYIYNILIYMYIIYLYYVHNIFYLIFMTTEPLLWHPRERKHFQLFNWSFRVVHAHSTKNQMVCIWYVLGMYLTVTAHERPITRIFEGCCEPTPKRGSRCG